MKSFRPLSLFFLFSILLPFSHCAKTKIIYIGFAGSITGDQHKIGTEARDALLLGIDDFNARGGIKGQKLKLLIEDDKDDSSLATYTAERLTRQGCQAIIGHMTSNMVKAAYPYINNQKIVLISPTASSSLFSGKDDYFFRLNNDADKETCSLAEYAYTEMGLRNLTGIADTDNQTYAITWINQFSRRFQSLGAEESKITTFSSNEIKSYYGFVKEIMTAGSLPEGFFIAATPEDTSALCQQIRKLNTEVHIFASGWARTQDLIIQGGTAVEGVYFSELYFGDNTSPAYREFSDRFKARYSREPDTVAILTYESLLFLIRGLETRNPGEELKDALSRIKSIQGILGPISFDAFGDVHRKAYITRVKEGVFTPLKTLD